MNPIQTPQLQAVQPCFFFAGLFEGGLFEVDELGLGTDGFARPGPPGA